MFFSIILLIILVFFRYGGEFLVAEDNLGDIDNAAIVLLMGSIPDRVLGAFDLYDEGKGNKILMVRSKLIGYEELQDRGVSIPGGVDISKIVLLELGVADDDITILAGEAQSTKDEALVIRDYLVDRSEIDKLLLVTSKFHSQRSKFIFKKALGNLDIEILSAPTPYDPFKARGWYMDREDLQSVVTEYLKMIHFFLLEQFQVKP